MKYIVDRIEGIFAVCEDEEKNIVNIIKSKLPFDVKEGDVVVTYDFYTYVIDKEATNSRKKYIEDLFNNL